jgi:LacI family transcriptional regulator
MTFSAMGSIRALHEAGLRVPEEVSVGGFDDIESAAYQKPGLTTVLSPLRKNGKNGSPSCLAPHRETGRKTRWRTVPTYG